MLQDHWNAGYLSYGHFRSSYFWVSNTSLTFKKSSGLRKILGSQFFALFIVVVFSCTSVFFCWITGNFVTLLLCFFFLEMKKLATCELQELWKSTMSSLSCTYLVLFCLWNLIWNSLIKTLLWRLKLIWSYSRTYQT